MFASFCLSFFSLIIVLVAARKSEANSFFFCFTSRDTNLRSCRRSKKSWKTIPKLRFVMEKQWRGNFVVHRTTKNPFSNCFVSLNFKMRSLNVEVEKNFQKKKATKFLCPRLHVKNEGSKNVNLIFFLYYPSVAEARNANTSGDNSIAGPIGLCVFMIFCWSCFRMVIDECNSEVFYCVLFLFFWVYQKYDLHNFDCFQIFQILILSGKIFNFTKGF